MNFKRPIILASSSPRRQFLLNEIGLKFKVLPASIDESFPEVIPVFLIPRYLAQKKGDGLDIEIEDKVIIAADTVVILQNRILNKPADRDEAIRMLSALSGNTHTVVTAVYLKAKESSDIFEDRTQVTFKTLNRNEIEHYVDQFKPFDKAGAYGAQECLPIDMNPCSAVEIDFLHSIGKVQLIGKSMSRLPASAMEAITRIDGSYFNVMGLPVHKVYSRLKHFSG